MEIQFAPDQDLSRIFTRAECCTSMYDRGNFWIGASFGWHVRHYQPYGPRHISVGRFRPEDINIKGEGYVSPKATCVLPWTYIECETGDLLDNIHATRITLEVLDAEGYDLTQMHLVYSGNKSLWIGIPSAALGNPIGSVMDQKALRQRIFLPLMESRVDEHLWDARHLHRLVGSRHETGGQVQVLPAEIDFPIEWIQRQQGPEAAAILWSNPYVGPVDPPLHERTHAKTQFHVPLYDSITIDIKGSSFMNDTEDGVGRGQRNWVCFRRACVLLRRMSRADAKMQLLAWNERCDPPMPEKEVRSCIRSAENTIERHVTI